MFLKLTLFVLVVCVALMGSGCNDAGESDPTKPAGPGGERSQPYNPDDGTYK